MVPRPAQCVRRVGRAAHLDALHAAPRILSPLRPPTLCPRPRHPSLDPACGDDAWLPHLALPVRQLHFGAHGEQLRSACLFLSRPRRWSRTWRGALLLGLGEGVAAAGSCVPAYCATVREAPGLGRPECASSWAGRAASRPEMIGILASSRFLLQSLSRFTCLCDLYGAYCTDRRMVVMRCRLLTILDTCTCTGTAQKDAKYLWIFCYPSCYPFLFLFFSGCGELAAGLG